MRTPILLALLLFAPAHAEFLSGEDLFVLMSGNEAQRAHALAYIKGAHDAGQYSAHCAPPMPEAHLVEIVRLVLVQMAAQRATLSADRFINAPLQMSFPCPRRTRGVQLISNRS